MYVTISPFDEWPHTGSHFLVSLQLLCAEYVVEGGGSRLNEVGTGRGVVTLDILLFP
jgi:hypothetical protein